MCGGGGWRMGLVGSANLLYQKIKEPSQPLLGLLPWQGNIFPCVRLAVYSFALLQHRYQCPQFSGCQTPQGGGWCPAATAQCCVQLYHPCQMWSLSAGDGLLTHRKELDPVQYVSPLAVNKHCTTWYWCVCFMFSMTSNHALVSSLSGNYLLWPHSMAI